MQKIFGKLWSRVSVLHSDTCIVALAMGSLH